ncbi:hypothetical protein N7519_002360 [Penicillium mononematosum]|uniref:uncharacterized protein n=1 Tax=Penicillium mononematosum TaxID=268346 RepID=UPI00254676F9|nr:uncharacterized protein N7519_002360 [Penicillium mononematosum]KAJ6187452.1 hypothetical protein N7519_002360 [Penicillium mononematosum]
MASRSLDLMTTIFPHCVDVILEWYPFPVVDVVIALMCLGRGDIVTPDENTRLFGNMHNPPKSAKQWLSIISTATRRLSVSISSVNIPAAHKDVYNLDRDNAFLHIPEKQGKIEVSTHHYHAKQNR